MSLENKLFSLAEAEIDNEQGLFNPHGAYDAANAAMCKLLGEKLAKTYPGYPWGVMSEIEHGIVKIAIQGFTQWPITIRVNSLKGDPSLRLVVKFAGELLERLQLSREKFSMDAFMSATHRLPHHFHRNAKAPE